MYNTYKRDFIIFNFILLTKFKLQKTHMKNKKHKITELDEENIFDLYFLVLLSLISFQYEKINSTVLTQCKSFRE